MKNYREIAKRVLTTGAEIIAVSTLLYIITYSAIEKVTLRDLQKRAGGCCESNTYDKKGKRQSVRCTTKNSTV